MTTSLESHSFDLPLSQPVGSLMRPAPSVQVEESLERTAYALREGGSPLVAVLNGAFLAGAVSETSFGAALARGCSASDSVRDALLHRAPTIQPYATGAEALRRFESESSPGLLVVDDYGRLLGFVTPSDLAPKPYRPPRPPLIGGMATPFGVHLTTGALKAGTSDIALITTGMTLFALLFCSGMLAEGTIFLLNMIPALARLDIAIGDTLSLIFFLIGMRLIPLSGIHAAEHKVVHAIERGEELTRENVRRMPRVHPRCGTNLAAGASLFIGLGTANWIPVPELRLLFAAIITLMFWRPLGSLLQYWVTTKEPTDKQLDMGIRSGKELLSRYAQTRSASPSIFMRIWNSGLIHVMAGSVLVSALLAAVGYLFNIQELKGII